MHLHSILFMILNKMTPHLKGFGLFFRLDRPDKTNSGFQSGWIQTAGVKSQSGEVTMSMYFIISIQNSAASVFVENAFLTNDDKPPQYRSVKKLLVKVES